MNGHNITKVGPNLFCFTGIALTEGGTVNVDVKEGTWSSETTTTYSGGPSNRLTVRRGARFDLYSLSNPFTWSLSFEDGSAYNVRQQANSAQNVLTGPVELVSGTVSMSADSNIGPWSTIKGPVTGAGRLKKTVGGRLILTGGANTYSGGTEITGGELKAVTPGDLPGWDETGKVTMAGGRLILPLSETNWTENAIHTLLDKATFSSDNGMVVLENAKDTALATDFPMGIGSWGKIGAGKMTVDHTNLSVTNGTMEVFESELNLTGTGTHFLNRVYVHNNATLRFDHAVCALTSPNNGKNVNVGLENYKTAWLMVKDDALLATASPISSGIASSAINIGVNASACGVMIVEDRAVVSNKVILGLNNRSQGALIQNGGSIYNMGGAANDIRIGEAGYGYYELNNGFIDFFGYSTIGNQLTSIGVMYQKGGYAKFSGTYAGRFGLSRGGVGVYYQTGGTFVHNSYLWIGESDGANSGQGGETFFTIDGPDALTACTYVGLCNRTNHTAIINLNDGVLSTAYITGRATFGSVNQETAVGFVNFNGGTLQARSQDGDLFSADVSRQPDAVTIYPRGAILDSSNYVVRVPVPLLKPEGKGVSAITFTQPSNFRYIGAPYVKITGGGGRGASAVANFDFDSGRVTGVTVTSPGTGYTSAPTVTVTGGGYTNLLSATATLADNSPAGGLTKRGVGTVSLDAANTFGGPVTIEKGTLVFNSDNAFPAGNDLNLNGGTLNANGRAMTVGTFSATSGTVSNARISADSFTKTGEGELSVTGSSIESVKGIVNIAEGSLLIRGGANVGLGYGVLAGAANVTDPNPCTSVVSDFARANSRSGWTDNTTAVYTGYIWNRSDQDVTWTFIENFDDTTVVKIDDKTVISDYRWSACARATVTLSPGPHLIEARFGQGSGGAGPSTQCTNGLSVASMIGFACDFQGRNSLEASDYTFISDPGDGSLLTRTPSDGGSVFAESTRLSVADGAAVGYTSHGAAVCAGLSGCGVISNCDVTVTGTLSADAVNFGAGHFLKIVDGSLDVSTLTLALTNVDVLPTRGGSWPIVHADNGIIGKPAVVTGLPNGRWTTIVRDDDLCLVYNSGTIFVVR